MSDDRSSPTDQPEEIATILGFLRAWSIFRRNQATYPTGHPLLEKTGQKAAQALIPMLKGYQRIDIGVTKNDLLLNDEPLSNYSPQISSLAYGFYRRGIAIISLSQGVTWHEILQFGEFLDLDQAEDDFDHALARFDLCHIALTPHDFTRISTLEQERVSAEEDHTGQAFWAAFLEGFVGDILENTRSSHGSASSAFDSKGYAEQLNDRFRQKQNNELNKKALGKAFLALQEATDSPDQQWKPYERLAQFVMHLDPEVRHLFLERGIEVLDEDSELIEQILNHLPYALLEELIAAERKLDREKTPRLLLLLERLTEAEGIQNPSTILLRGSAGKEEFRTVFREDQSEHFVSSDYRVHLDRLRAASLLPALTPDAVRELTQSLQADTIEKKVCAVFLEVVKHLPPQERDHMLAQHLEGITNYFLDTGDFHSLHALYLKLKKGWTQQEQGHSNSEQQKGLELFRQPFFIAGVLNSLNVWGKPKYAEIQRVIVLVGAPFIDPLLQALADETRLSLRRYYMACLAQMGPVLRPYLQSCLTDERWYFLRNIIILLRGLEDPRIIPSLEGLLDHSHPRVRQEVIRTFLQFNDPRGLKTLFAELDSGDPERELTAIRLASQTRSSVVVRKLLSMLSLKNLRETEIKRQLALIEVLADSQNADVLPHFKRLLKAGGLFKRRAKMKIKAAICHHLRHVHDPEVDRLLRSYASSSHPEIARAAQQSLQHRQSGEGV